MEMEDITEEAVTSPNQSMRSLLPSRRPRSWTADPTRSGHVREPPLGEDPAYDPEGIGRQPDVDEDEEDYG
jgi:hypothetical protein